MHVRPEQRDVGRARERRLPGQALVKDTAERVHVGPRVDLVTGDLLRGDVLERADDVARSRDAAERAGPLRQPEVGQVAVLLARRARDQHVRRLHVPVHEPPLVRCVQRLRDLLEKRNRAARLERAFRREQLPEVGALDVAHREEEGTVVFPRTEDRDDVRMVERRGDTRLVQEALPESVALRELGSDHLQRHPTPEAELLGAIDRAHSASADEPFDLVAGNLAPDYLVGAPSQGHPWECRPLARHLQCFLETQQSAHARAEREHKRTIRPCRASSAGQSCARVAGRRRAQRSRRPKRRRSRSKA